MTREHLYEFIRKQKTAFAASVDEDGFPNLKAMFTPRKIEEDCFYFSTNTSSMRTQQYMENSKASIYFYYRGRFRYEGIMLIGNMEVLQDLKIKEGIILTNFEGNAHMEISEVKVWRNGKWSVYENREEYIEWCDSVLSSLFMKADVAICSYIQIFRQWNIGFLTMAYR